MRFYDTISRRTNEHRVQFHKLLGNKPVAETIDMFLEGEISPDLRVAYSCWQTMLPGETQRLQIVVWIDLQRDSGILEQLDNQIEDIESRLHSGRNCNQEELAEINRLLVKPVTRWETLEGIGRAFLEEKAIEKLKRELANGKLDTR